MAYLWRIHGVPFMYSWRTFGVSMADPWRTFEKGNCGDQLQKRELAIIYQNKRNCGHTEADLRVS